MGWKVTELSHESFMTPSGLLLSVSFVKETHWFYQARYTVTTQLAFCYTEKYHGLHRDAAQNVFEMTCDKMEQKYNA